MFYAFYHNWSIVFCETKSKLFPARIPNYQAVFRKVWILYKFGFVEKSKLLDFSTMRPCFSVLMRFVPLPVFSCGMLPALRQGNSHSVPPLPGFRWWLPHQIVCGSQGMTAVFFTRNMDRTVKNPVSSFWEKRKPSIYQAA